MIREDYQETLIGEIPSEWRVGKLGNYLDLIRNGITKQQNHDGIGYLVSRIQTISEDDINPEQVGYLKEIDEDDIEKFRLHPGDILFSHINSEPQIGRSVIYEGYPEFLLHGMNLLRLRTRKELDSHYLNFLFNLYRRLGVFIGIASRSVNQSSINQGKLKALDIIVPPLPEQRAIAHVLSIVRQAIDGTEQVIAAARELKRSMMKHLFTYGPIPVYEADQVPLKEAEFRDVPERWDMVPLGKIFESVTVRMKNIDKSSREIPILSMTRAHGLILQSEKFDKRVASRDTSNYKVVNYGQLVYGFPIDEGVIAILHRYPIGAVSPAYKVWEPIVDVDLTYIDHLLKMPFMINTYRMFSSNVVERRRNLAQRDFIRIPIPIPPKEEQNAISNFIKIMENKIDTEIWRKEALEDLFNSLLHHLMTGKVRVKI